MGFGLRLRNLREAAGLTLVEMGEKAGMPYQNIARFERGDREPTWATLLKLANALDVSLDDFRDPDQPADADPEPRPMRKRK